MKTLQLTDTEWAYLAGLIDGEGTIGMSRGYDTQKNRISKKLRFRLRINIVTTSVSLAAWIDMKIGCITTPWDHHGNPKHAPCYRLAFSERPAEEIVIGVLPYLVIKKQQAELFLRYREVQKFSFAHRRESRARIKSITLLREWFCAEFHRLNARGRETVETNTPDIAGYGEAVMKIESELRGDVQRAIGDDAPPAVIVQ